MKGKNYAWEVLPIFKTFRLYWKDGFYKTLFFSIVFYPFPIIFGISPSRIKKKKDKILQEEVVKYISKKYGLKFTHIEGPFSLGGLIEVFIKKLYDSFEVTERDVVYDLGATIGEYSLKCAKNGAICLAFELEKEPYDAMVKNIRINNLKDYVIPIHCKIDNKKNSIDLFVKKTKKIPTIIKIDIEGDEGKALEGTKNLLKKYKPKIILETHSVRLERFCINFLKRRGYKISHKINLGGGSGEVKLFFLNTSQDS